MRQSQAPRHPLLPRRPTTRDGASGGGAGGGSPGSDGGGSSVGSRSALASMAAAAGGLLRRMQLSHKRAPSMLQFDIELADSEDALSRRCARGPGA